MKVQVKMNCNLKNLYFKYPNILFYHICWAKKQSSYDILNVRLSYEKANILIIRLRVFIR